MSLFKILEWFTYQSPDSDPNYDSSSITCARLSNDNEQQRENIIVTSHSGHISILRPSYSDPENLQQNVDQQSHHSSIVYEAKLSDPILGVLCGNFIQYSQKHERQNNNIAILHPRKLVISSLVTSSGLAEHGQQSKLQTLLQHDLQKSAFTFCKGNFGGVKGKEFICVMYLDGSLTFFEQDGISQNCILPGNRTIHTNFAYISRTDCFVILAPNWDLECYRYLSLSESFERKFSPIWTLNLGEYILDLNCHQISNSESLIVLLGENNLICVTDTGKMKFIKKLDYTPLSFCSFVVGWYFEPDCKLIISVATENGSLLIYHNSTLVWCAELSDETIALRRGNFVSLTGALVTLNTTGKVCAGFLGADPTIFKVPPINLSKLDYEKSKTELEEMEKEINSSVDNSDVPFINASADKDLQIKSHLHFEDLHDGEFCRLQIKLQASVNIEQIQIFITPNSAFVVPENIFFFKDLRAHDKHSFETTIYASESQVSELFLKELNIMVSFINKQCIARVIKHVVDIPLKAVLKKSEPQKDASYKITLSVVQPIDFAAIFQDLNFVEIGQAIGLKTFNSESNITLVMAKNSNRYRLQSNSLAALAFILNVLTQDSAAAGKMRRNVLVKSIPMSIVEFLLTTIEKHRFMRTEINKIYENLNKKTVEMRLFERCFLVKIQGKAAKDSMDGISVLLRATYNEILSLSGEYKKIKTHVERVQIQLASIIYFTRKVIENADLQQPKIKENLLCITRPLLADFQDQTWIEAAAPYVDYLHRMYQTKSKENQFYEMMTFRNDNFSITRFLKQMKVILSVIVESSIETINNVERILTEEPELKEDDSEWTSKVKEIHEIETEVEEKS